MGIYYYFYSYHYNIQHKYHVINEINLIANISLRLFGEKKEQLIIQFLFDY